MKPPFLTRPESWLRSGSGADDPVRYACALEAPRPTSDRTERCLLLAVALLVALLFTLGVI